MTALSVVLRGIRYRAGRSLVMLALATLAVGVTVLTPAYARAAQQSVLATRLAAAPPNAVALHVTGEGTTGAVKSLLPAPPPGYAAVPVAAADVPAVVDGTAVARLAYRDDVCAHLTVSSGQCTGVLVSERSAIAVGRRLTLHIGQSSTVVTVGGLYTPRDPAEPYWGRGGYFAAGPGSGDDPLPRLDAVFAPAESALAIPGVRPSVSLDYPLRVDQVTLDGVGRLDDGVTRFATAVNGAQLAVDTSIGAVLDDIGTEVASLGRTVPVVAVPLILVSWFVVYLVVVGVVEERAPEVGLAKLRGFTRRRATGFGRAESTVLALLAVPLGIATGLGSVELLARTGLAPGVPVEPARAPVAVAAVVALVLAIAVVRLGSGRPSRRPTLTLLRRVPVRTVRAAGLAEGLAVALASASLVAAVSDRGAPLALLAPALLAVVAGIVTARLLERWSRLRVRRHVHSGRITGVLAHAELARRPAGRRVMVVVTVAVALVTFGATAWDVAAQARTDAAVDLLGAPRVLRVAVDDPSTLESAVTRAAGDSAMAVVRVTERFDGGTVDLFAVDTTRLAGIVAWRDPGILTVAQVASSLRTSAADAVPAAVAGGAPADDPAATVFSFPSLGETAQRFLVVSTVDTLPRARGRAIMVDLGLAVAAADQASGLSDNTRLHYEVWASDAAPPDLAARLADAGVAVLADDSIPAEQARLAGGAPALGLRLALVAGGVAVLLAVGAVLLSAYLGARPRRYELAALRVAGVRRGVLRAALLREYAHVLLLPGLVGMLVGLAGAALMLPGTPLVTAGVPTTLADRPDRFDAVTLAGAATAVGLMLAVLAVLRLASGATPDRLRDGAQ